MIQDLGIDVVVISDLFPEVIEICNANNIRIIWLATQSDINRADWDSDGDLLSKVEIASESDIENEFHLQGVTNEKMGTCRNRTSSWNGCYR